MFHALIEDLGTEALKRIAMTPILKIRERPTDQPSRAVESGRRLKFAGYDGFQGEVRRRVDEYFRTTGRQRRDCWQMYLKTGILLACFAAAYLRLVFVA